MKFTAAALTILLTGVASISAATLRGKNASDNINYRRHFLPEDTECVLYKKDVQFEDGHGEESWSCEYTPEQAARFGGVEMMDIKGLTQEEIEAKGAISGETILRATSTYVEEFDGNAGSKNVLQIPENSKFEIQEMDRETDVRHAGNRRARRQHHRNLADSTPGTLKVLVVRVVDSAGAKVNADALQLKDDIFTDDVCIKTQYAACSHDQLIIEQATEFGTNVNGVQVNGIVDVTIEATASQGKSTLESQALAKATTDYGGGSSLSATYDLVMFCQPPGSGTWVAYAYINDWRSYYNDYWCQRVSAQMHEVGHNFNLAHSGIPNGSEYGDQSGMMGYSYNSDDGPKMCFNAAKSYQLGWYDAQTSSINPLNYSSNPQTFVMNGVADYEKDGSNGDALVSLRLENKGLAGGFDYYIGYNRKIGANIGTNGVPDTVTLLEKDGRNGYGKSRRLAAMTVGQSTQIQNYAGTTLDVFVTVDSINGKDATITISTSEPAPTAAPTPCVGATLQIGLKIDNWGSETEWTIVDNETNIIVAESQDAYTGNTEYVLPSETDSYCLQEDKCYTFTITDGFGDGICCAYGNGYYKGFLNGNTTPIFEGGEFGASESKEFCVPSSDLPTATPITAPTEPPTISPTSLPPTKTPTKSPTATPITPTSVPTSSPTLFPTFTPTAFPSDSPSAAPTSSPSASPTSVPTEQNTCQDDPDFAYKNSNKKNCDWLGDKKLKKKQLLCQKRKWEKIKLYKWCPETCGKVGVGPCVA